MLYEVITVLVESPAGFSEKLAAQASLVDLADGTADTHSASYTVEGDQISFVHLHMHGPLLFWRSA